MISFSFFSSCFLRTASTFKTGKFVRGDVFVTSKALGFGGSLCEDVGGLRGDRGGVPPIPVMRVSLIRDFTTAAYCAAAQERLCRLAQPLLVSGLKSSGRIARLLRFLRLGSGLVVASGCWCWPMADHRFLPRCLNWPWSVLLFALRLRTPRGLRRCRGGCRRGR